MKTVEDILQDHVDPHCFMKPKCYEACIDAMEEYASQSKWISVEDRLPEECTAVLATGYCCEVCGYNNHRIAEIEDGKWWETSTGDNFHFKVTHWQPLPKPPITK